MLKLVSYEIYEQWVLENYNSSLINCNEEQVNRLLLESQNKVESWTTCCACVDDELLINTICILTYDNFNIDDLNNQDGQVNDENAYLYLKNNGGIIVDCSCRQNCECC